MVNCVKIICKLIREAIIISPNQDFEADFQWKVSLKILNSGLILKTFTHHACDIGLCQMALLNSKFAGLITYVELSVVSINTCTCQFALITCITMLNR